MAGGFVEDDRGGSGGVERLNAAGHGDADARVGAALDFLGEAGAFVADEQGDGLAPVDFPGGEERRCDIATLWRIDNSCGAIRIGHGMPCPYSRGKRADVFTHAGGQRADGGDFKLCQENGEGHSGEDWEVEGGPGGGAQRLRRIRAGGAADAGGGSGTAGRAKSGGRAEDGSHIAGILYAGENDEKRSAGRSGSADEVVEGSFARFDQRGDALRMLGVGKTFKEAIGRAKRRKTYLGPVDQRREAFVMALAGFAEEHRLDGAAGAQRFFDEADAFDSDEAVFRGQAAAEGKAKLLEPAIVAAGEQSGIVRRSRVTGGFAGRGHSLQVSKFVAGDGNAETGIQCPQSPGHKKSTLNSLRFGGTMATGVIPQSKHRFEDLFFIGMAVVILASVFVGFAPSYYLAGVFKAPPLPNLLVHIHGAVFSTWILLLITQTSLVGAGRVDVHRRLGLLGFGLACVVVILGVLVGTENLVRHYHRNPGDDGATGRAFYAVPLADMLMFGTLVYFAFRNRFNPAAHKRLILIATLSILDAAFDRWPIPAPWWDFRFTPLLCCYPLLLLLMGYDWWSTGKVQRVTLWASGFLVVVQTGRIFVGRTAVWQSFATWVYTHARSYH